jgi:hypothetical protein
MIGCLRRGWTAGSRGLRRTYLSSAEKIPADSEVAKLAKERKKKEMADKLENGGQH